MGIGQNGIGNRELKELICTTHGHELSGGGIAGGKGHIRLRWAKGKNWDN